MAFQSMFVGTNVNELNHPLMSQNNTNNEKSSHDFWDLPPVYRQTLEYQKEVFEAFVANVENVRWDHQSTKTNLEDLKYLGKVTVS